MKAILISFYKLQLASFTLGESDNDKIVGGEEAVPHSYPFTAAITLEGLCCCGGSILGMRVLNLAHLFSCRNYKVLNPLRLHSSRNCHCTGDTLRLLTISLIN